MFESPRVAARNYCNDQGILVERLGSCVSSPIYPTFRYVLSFSVRAPELHALVRHFTV